MGAQAQKRAGKTWPGRLLGWFLMLSVVGGCSCDPATLTPPPFPLETPDTGDLVEDTGPDASFPDSGIGTPTLLISRVVPNHGPFIGGNTAIVRGTGFTDESFVQVGGRLVQPADTRLIDRNRLQIVLPAGEPGPADVTVRVGDDEASLPGGYTYDQIYIEPSRGAVSGGTVVNIVGTGTTFEDGDTVMIGPSACEDVERISETRLSCRTPPGVAGFADVVVTYSADETSITIPNGFEYYDSSDPFGGGLGGGELTGTMNVTVLNALTGLPVSDAFTIIGEDLETEHQGLTNIGGQITFSGEDVMGNLRLHVSKFCFERTSVVSFDAQDVTIFLIPWMDPMCGEGGGPPPPGRGRSGAFVSGELVFRGPIELGPNPWLNIPPPRENEIKVAYVYTTQPCAGESAGCQSPSPTLGGAVQRVLEENPGELGYPYRIFVRPSAFAIYSIAGLENTVTGEFIPYVMGVTRNVLAGPGDEVEKVNIDMVIPLDHYLDVRLDGLGSVGRTGPDRFRVSAELDLGGEGVIRRVVNGESFDVVAQRSIERPFRFFAQPALLDTLEDGRYQVHARYLTGDFGADPSSHRIVRGIRTVDEEITVSDFVGVPLATAPAFGERLPADRILRWEADGAPVDFHIVLVIGGDGNPAWRQFVRGDTYEAYIPDLSAVPDIDDISPGFITWAVFSVHIPGHDFDTFSYRDLNQRTWASWAIDTFTAQF